MKPEQWIVTGEVGTSSRTIWAVMMGVAGYGGDFNVPHDPDDFRRCYLLLKEFPVWREQLHFVSEKFKKWIPFVREWDKLTEMFEKALESGTGKAPEMFELMQELEEEGMLLDGWVKTGVGSFHKDR